MTDDTRGRIADVLKQAIKGEEDGYRFYHLLSEKATNAEARRKLEGLRDDEARHKAALIEMYRQHVGGDVGELPEKGIAALAEVFRSGRLDEKKTEMEFINLAIEAELAATRFYDAEKDKTDDTNLKSLLDQLAREEHGHYEILQAEKDALGGNYHWFGLGDGSPMEH